MKKLLFIAVPNFRDTELFDTKKALGPDFHVQIASNTLSAISGVEGSDVVPNHFIENAIPADFDGIVIIGGGGMHDTLTNDTTTTQQIVAQVKAFSEARKLVSAICIGPIALAKAGVITGKRITGWDDGNNTQKTEIESAGATFTAEPVTVDGNLITANGPSAATAFGEAIKNYFSKEETSNAEEKN
jgi:protease I|tara:strand:+ start:10213 stop:10773 length:561 start_codon:yes stop_codon:yes gene_type:complete